MVLPQAWNLPQSFHSLQARGLRKWCPSKTRWVYGRCYSVWFTGVTITVSFTLKMFTSAFLWPFSIILEIMQKESYHKINYLHEHNKPSCLPTSASVPLPSSKITEETATTNSSEMGPANLWFAWQQWAQLCFLIWFLFKSTINLKGNPMKATSAFVLHGQQHFPFRGKGLSILP